MTAYERALEEQIAYLQAELERYRAAQRRAAAETQDFASLPTEDGPPIRWAMRDPNFLQWWLLRQQVQGGQRR